MSSQGVESPMGRSSSPAKHAIDDDGETYSYKRRKVEQAERPPSSRELAPRPTSLMVKPASTTPSQVKTTNQSNNRRASSLNLKNYPSNHHPVGISIWILQKVEQARRELEAQRSASYSSDLPRNTSPVQTLASNPPSGYAESQHWQGPSFTNYVNLPPAQEQEAGRLQAQRNRKTKQRQENWAKSESLTIRHPA